MTRSNERAALDRIPVLRAASHLIAWVVAAVLVGVVLVAGDMYAERVEARYIHALAPEQFLQKNQGSALQLAAFRQPDLLPVYGSSELQTLDDPYHGSNFFKDYPTGFTIFTVGDFGTTTLIMVQRLAAMGADARGKKVVFSLSPYWYYQLSDYSGEYVGNFSALHAGEMLFSGSLSLGLRERIAKRMQQYPAALENRPILRVAVNQLARNSWVGRLVYFAIWPLGRLQNAILRLQDHWETLAYIRGHGLDPSVPRRPAAIDWPSQLRDAQKRSESHNDKNPLGFDNQYYERRFQRTLSKNKLTNETFRAGLDQSTEWIDLELLLQVANELGAEPLVLCAPGPGLYYDYLGISEELRSEYFRKFDRVVRGYGAPVFSFADHDRDKAFVLDPGAHMSEKGWAYLDQAMDTFYHGRLEQDR